MNYCKSILICGGDRRQVYLYKAMKSEGYNADAFGLGLSDNVGIEKIGSYDVVILPVPVSVDGITLNTPLVDDEIYLEDILSRLTGIQTVLGGMCGKLNYNMIDYYENEELQMLNAIPTAEGAIQTAMENTDFTINQSKCLVIGYGRIGKMLAKRLADLGAFVCVCARSEKDLALANAYGYHNLCLSHLGDNICGYDIIFNTVPKTIVNSEMLGKIDKGTLIIDLASKPYGIDMSAARALGRKVIIASGLPGKLSPKTSGLILKSIITKILLEQEV